MKPKKCRTCKEPFIPTQPLQICCDYQCALSHAKAARRRTERKVYKEAKERLKTKSQWLKEAQFVFNKYIRKRDENTACISGGSGHNGQRHAGHYRSVGSSPHLRFDERNCHGQCAYCNNHLSGNQINYRRGLVAKIGVGEVEALEADNTPKNYTIDDIKQLIIEYKAKIKGMS